MALYQFEYFDDAAWQTYGRKPENGIAVAGKSDLPRVSAASFLYWTEHCVECAYPDCYTTCDLYTPRRDMACRRFPYGIARADKVAVTVGDAARVAFGKWAHLWCIGSPVCVPLAALRNASRLHRAALAAAEAGNALLSRKTGWMLQRFFGVRYRAVDSLKRISPSQSRKPHGFLIRVVNPQAEIIPLTLTIRNFPPRADFAHFTWKQDLGSGYTESFIPISEIESLVDLRQQIRLSFNILPLENRELVFHAADFVQFAAAPVLSSTQPIPQIKCLVFDLDNTLWQGVLLEMEGVVPQLREGIENLLRDLDRRGILLSIASKNNEAEALAALETLGISGYFLHPQISWNPKSEGIQRIAQLLNIGLDAIAFVDDQPFERAEVSQTLPEVVTVDDTVLLQLSDDPRFAGSATAEAAGRRQLYQAEASRKAEAGAFRGDFREFLRSCEIQLSITRPTEEDVPRLHELIQRTNQLNFSGRRYTREELEGLLRDPRHENYIIQVSDRFGNYGSVGYARLSRESDILLMEDLALSCRVQAKHIEHTFFKWLGSRAQELGYAAVRVRYQKTERNAPAGKVFDDLNFSAEFAEKNLYWLRADADVLANYESPVHLQEHVQ